MFSPATVSLIKATVPLLRQRGEDITRHFYASMFRDHPDMKAFFNESHQAEGTQARALAGAVLAYAAHIDQLDTIAPALPRIIQKHAALGVLPEHYPVVGQCLLRAIAQVLGESATDEVLAAWGEAYGALAQLLIDAEEQVYAAHASAPGGWRGARPLRLVRKEPESEIITSFYFKPADGGDLMDYQAGQYLTLVLTLDGKEVRRNYSLSDAPGRGWYRISVKREPNGRVSNWLHDHLTVGDQVQALPPCGDFVLDASSTRPLVFVTAGVGITPAMSMLETVASTGRPVHFIHAAQHSAVHAFRDRVDALAQAHPNVQPLYLYDQPRPGCAPHRVGRVSTDLLAGLLPEDRNVDLYFLGPKPFMQQVFASAKALHIPESQVRFEFFGPLEALAA